MYDAVEFVLCYGGDGAVLEVFSEGHCEGGCFCGVVNFFCVRLMSSPFFM